MRIHFHTGSGEEAGFNFFMNGNRNITDRVLGPSGLLSFFELHSGLTAIHHAEPFRLMALRNRLCELIDEHHPFYRSFSGNELAVCSDLLQLYDELTMLEWKGDFIKSTPRLQLLSETMDVLKDYPGESDRWVALSEYLKVNPFPGGVVGEILVYDGEEWIHPFYRKFFRIPHLPEVRYVKAVIPVHSSNNLELLKQKFLHRDFSSCRFNNVREDNSVLIISNVDVSLLADVVNSIDRNNCILINGGQAGFIDAAAKRSGLPLSGLFPGSLNNGFNMLPFQLANILKAAPDALTLINFLQNSICPVSNELRFPLLKLLHSKPGFEPGYWKKELLEGNDEGESHFLIDHEKNSSSDKGIRQEIDLWFVQPQKAMVRENQYWFNRHEIRNLFLKAAKRLQEEKKEKEAGTFLKQIIAVLDHYPVDEMGELQLYLFLSGFIKPVGSVATMAETGFMPCVDSASSVISSFDTVIWWNFSAKSLTQHSSRFFSVEKELLRNTSLYDDEFEKAMTARWYFQEIRPILNCNKRLILITSGMMNGQETDRHPFLDFIEGSVGDPGQFILDPGAGHTGFFMSLADLIPGLCTEIVTPREIPQALVSWNLEPGLAMLSKTESFSSLEKLIYYPHEYLLERIAGLKDYSPPDPDETLLNFGNCSHRILELLFRKPGILKAGDGDLVEMVDQLLSQVIREQFIALDAPEFGLQRQSFRLRMQKAVKILFAYLRKGNFIEVIPEENFTKENAVVFGNIILTGKIDLHLTTKEGKKAILDFKWSGSSKRRKMLKEEKDLQLCLYSYLLSSSPEVPTAFFIIDSAQLISYRNDLFPEASTVYSEKRYTDILSEIAGKIMQAYDHRKTEMENGYVEVGLETEYSTLAENSKVWEKGPEGADFPKAYSADSKMRDKKPSCRYSDYTVFTPVK